MNESTLEIDRTLSIECVKKFAETGEFKQLNKETKKRFISVTKRRRRPLPRVLLYKDTHILHHDMVQIAGLMDDVLRTLSCDQILNELHNRLLQGNETEFIEMFESYADEPKIKANAHVLFYDMAALNLTTPIDTLLAHGIEIPDDAFRLTMKHGSSDTLAVFLEHKTPENVIGVLRHGRLDSEAKDTTFDKCIDLLLDTIGQNIINVVDEFKHSAIYYLRRRPDKVRLMLEMGANIGLQQQIPDFAFIDPQVLEEHFDKCLRYFPVEMYVETGKARPIAFDFKNLVSPRTEDGHERVIANEMVAIKYMANSNGHRHLLTHPLIWCFIWLKWQRLSNIFYLDFLLYSIFTYLATCSILLVHNSKPIGTALMIATSVFSVHLIVRRLINCISCNKSYRQSWEFHMHNKLTLLILIFLTFTMWLKIDYNVFLAICILLIVCQYFFLTASTFWTFSRYHIMFVTVAWNSIKSLQLAAILFPTFALMFHLFFAESDDEDNPFNTLYSATVKTLAMLIGEFGDIDIIKIDFHTSYSGLYLGWIVFIAFVLLMPIIFVNLMMTGLAINDSKEIVCNAELASLKQRCSTLSRYEKILSNPRHWFREIYRGTWIMRIFNILTYFEWTDALENSFFTEIYVGKNQQIIGTNAEFDDPNVSENLDETTTAAESSENSSQTDTFLTKDEEKGEEKKVPDVETASSSTDVLIDIDFEKNLRRLEIAAAPLLSDLMISCIAWLWREIFVCFISMIASSRVDAVILKRVHHILEKQRRVNENTQIESRLAEMEKKLTQMSDALNTSKSIHSKLDDMTLNYAELEKKLDRISDMLSKKQL